MQKKSKIIVGASVFIIFCISLMTFLWINSQSFKQETANLISKQVENILGTKININSLYIVSTNSAAIDDVEIYDKENELIAKADKVVFTIDFWQILRQSPLAGLSEVDVINPEVNIIQRSDGSWNVEDLIDKDSDTPVDFKGIVKVENGQSKLRFEGKQLSIDKINLEADCADLTAINLDGSLNHEDALVEFDGVVGEIIKTNLEIKAQDLDILKYLPFIPEEYLANVNIKQGFINKANITISGNLENQYTLDGSVSFVDGACEVLGQNVEDIRGIILLNNKNIQLFVSGSAQGQKVAVHGNIEDYMTEPRLRLIAESKSFRPELFIEGIPFNGEVSFVSAIYGTLDDIRIGAQVNSKLGYIYDYPIEDINIQARYRDNKVFIDDFRADFANGWIWASGQCDLADLSYKGSFRASNIDMSVFNNYLPDMEISGDANFSGRLSGDLDNPVLRIDLMAKDGSILNQPFDSLLVNAVGNLDGMRVDRCQFINDGEITHEATGVLGFKGKQFIDMVVQTKQARVENLMQVVMPEFKITGNVDNSIHLTGNLQDIKATGNVHFYEGSLYGILITQVDGTYEYNDGDIVLKDFVITSPFIKATLSGNLDKNKEMNFKFKADEILIDKLQVDLPYPVSGKASFDGVLTGKVGALNFDGILQADDIVLNGENIDDIYGHLKLANRILSLEQFKFKQNNGEFDFNGAVNLNTKQVEGKAIIVQADINAAMSMANLKNNLLNGRFDGIAQLNGTYENPHVDLNGTMIDGTLKDYPLQNIQIDAELDNKVVKIDKFYAEQGAGKVAAQGSIDLENGPIDARISASNMDVNLLTHLCDMNININGVMNGDIQVGGTIDEPTADISIYTQGDGTQFDNAYALANLKNGVIYINQMAANKGQCAIKAEGSIPIAALEMDKRNEQNINQQMNLKVYLENTDLNILPSLTPFVEWSMGNVQGDLNITGTVQKPNFKGNISTVDSAIKFKYIDSPLENINVDIDFDQDLMTVKRFTGKMGEGDYNLVGMAHLTSQGITGYSFNLDLNNLDIVSDYYTGHLVGNLQLIEEEFHGRRLPKLITNLDFNNIEVSMPPLPETTDTPLPEMLLDINVTLGDNVHAYDALLYDLYIKGAFNIKGTTIHPKSSGSLTVDKGTINVLKNIFKIEVGNIVFNQVDSFFPSIDFLAVTRLDRTKIFASLQGPLDKQLEPRLFSEPAMNDAEIIKLLAFRTDYKEGSSGEITEDDLLSLASVGLQMSFLNEIEGTLRNVLNLDEFRISRDSLSDSAKKRFDTDDGDVYSVQIGKYLSDKVMLRYTKGINYDLNRVGLQYYMNNNVGIITEVEDDGVYNIKLEMQWKF